MKELNKEMQDSRLKSVLEETDVHYLQRYQNNEKHGISCNTLEDLASGTIWHDKEKYLFRLLLLYENAYSSLFWHHVSD